MERLSCWHCIHAEIVNSREGEREILCRADPGGLFITQDTKAQSANRIKHIDPKLYWCHVGTWAIRYWHRTNLWNKLDIINDSGVQDSKTVRLITRDGKNIEAEVPWVGEGGKWFEWEGESWASSK